jgi:protein-disulfide isomerase
VYKHFVVHPQVATAPARAACAAHKQGKFHEMYETIWEKGFNAYREERDPQKRASHLGEENMQSLASEIGLNIDKYKEDLKTCARDVARDEADMRKVGISGTPGFFINGRYLRGAQPLPRFKALVDEELKKANDRIQKGEANAADYYNKFVLAKGKKTL